MRDLESRRWIIAKGALFLFLILTCSGLIYAAAPSWSTVFLLLVLIWSAARFYYFLFYVLEKYVNPSLRYAGVLSLIGAIVDKAGSQAAERGDPSNDAAPRSSGSQDGADGV